MAPQRASPAGKKRCKAKANRTPTKAKTFKQTQSKAVEDSSSGAKETLTSESSVKSKRGPVTMPRIVRRKILKIKKVVEYNKKGQPRGKVATELQSYIGVLARTKIPITFAKWKKVDNEYKNKIWEEIELAFEIAPESKKLVMKSAGAKWREFKSRLTTAFVLPFIDDLEKLKKPPAEYNFLEKADWDEFVQSRLEPNFLKLHEVQQERRAKAEYQHRMSRKGYAGLESELLNDMNSDQEEVDRATLWMKARANKEGKIIDAKAAELANRIEELKQQEKEGKLSTSGSNDVLTLALGTPEHGGRVRAVGSYVTPNSYFHLPKRRKTSVKENVRESIKAIVEEEREKIVAQIVAEEREKIKAEIMAEEKRKISAQILEEERANIVAKLVMDERDKLMAAGSPDWQAKVTTLDEILANVKGSAANIPVPVQKTAPPTPPTPHTVEYGSDKASCNAAKKVLGLNDNPKEDDIMDVDSEFVRESIFKGKQCKLVVEGEDKKIVAHATLIEVQVDNPTVHGIPLGKDNLRVSIYASFNDDALLPIPVRGELETVGQAKGCVVAWPKQFVLPMEENKKGIKKPLKAKADKHQKSVNKPQPLDLKVLPPTLKVLCMYAQTGMKKDATIHFVIEPEVFGQPRKIHVLSEDIEQFSRMEEISATCIVVYMRFLFDVVKKSKMNDMIGFIDPARMGAIGCGTVDERSRVLADRFKSSAEDQLYLVPYNSGNHWALTVVNPGKEIVHFLDPMRRRLCGEEWRTVVDNAIRIFKAQGNKKGNKAVVWKNLSGIPQQPTHKECGYFVMRFMKEIVEDEGLSFATK